MNIIDTVSWAYAAVPIVALAAWVPQVWRLVRNPTQGVGMSVPTWALWAVTGLVSVAYAALVVQDVLLTATFVVNAAGQIVVLGYAVAARLRHGRGVPLTGWRRWGVWDRQSRRTELPPTT